MPSSSGVRLELVGITLGFFEGFEDPDALLMEDAGHFFGCYAGAVREAFCGGIAGIVASGFEVGKESGDVGSHAGKEQAGRCGWKLAAVGGIRHGGFENLPAAEVTSPGRNRSV